MKDYTYYDSDVARHKVNWVSLLSDEELYRMQASERAITKSPLEEAIPVLIQKGFLSRTPKNNFWLNDGRGTNLSPRDSVLQPLFFTDIKDAEMYRLIRYRGAEYPVEITRN